MAGLSIYSALDELKTQLANGRQVSYVPLPDDTTRIIDPAFTKGLGFLFEDERGVQCPVRECGLFFHDLAQHLNRSHKVIGGARSVREALSIPPTAVLMSTRYREHLKERGRSNACLIEGGRHARFKKGRMPETTRKRNAAAKRRTRRSVMWQNRINSCAAQTRDKVLAVAQQLGRSPTFDELSAVLGVKIEHCINRVWGSWSNCKRQLGLEVYHGRRPRMLDDVLDDLRLWYEVHGRLPVRQEVEYPDRTPLIASVSAIRRAFGAHRWSECMQRAAALLGIYGGRYGLPERRDNEAAD
jgi:hypothetical protein